MKYAYYKGFGQDAEDFAQEYCIKMFEGRKASVKNIFIDYLRGRYGDSRSSFGLAKQRETRNAVDIDAADFKGLPVSIEDIGGECDSSGKRAVLCNKQKLVLTHQEISVLEKILEGYNFTSISDILGISQARVSQILKVAKGRISKANEIRRLKEEIILANGLIEIDWIVL